MVSFRLDNKLAIVTGCSSGIGEAIALEFAKQGADVIGVSRKISMESKLAKDIQSLGRKFYAYTADFSKRDSLYRFIEQVLADHSQIDILVNNAGHILRKPAAEHPDEYWDEIMNINLDAQFILTREIGKRMLQQASGKIIFTCSLLTFQGGVNVPGYAASKGALSSLLKAFSNEWASKGINVNGIAPGYIATPNTEALRNDAERNASILARIPANRWGEAPDLTGAYVFLASPASDYIHGSIITVDGGWMGR